MKRGNVKNKVYYLVLFVLTAACTLILLVGASASNDYYQCYQFGSCMEPTLSNDSNCRPVTDYDVTVSNKNSPVTVLSIHGGNIELNTSAISNALSSLYGWNRYDFNAHATSACTSVGSYQGNKLHITSTNFNDPRAVSLVSAQPKAVSIHGYSDTRGYDKGVICVGGKDGAARQAFISYIQNNAAAWNTNPNTYTLNPRDALTAADGTPCGDDEIRGKSDSNLVNRTSSNAGLQLELSRQSRADLVNTSPGFDDLRNLIYGAIRQAMLFQDSFTGSDGLITNEYAHWNPDGILSPDWDMTSGSLFRQSNTAWTGVPDSLEPNKYSSDHTNSNVFRLNTFRTFAGNIKLSLALKNNSEIHDPNCSACWHGVHVLLRHLTQFDLYAVSVNRADNKVVIKRKVPCGSDNEGFYKDLAPAVTHAWSVGTWQHYSVTIQTNSNGSVTIKVYDDDSDPNTPFLQATDAGGTNPSWTSGCVTPGHYPTAQYPPITAAGRAGIRGDFDNFNFDDFRISSF